MDAEQLPSVDEFIEALAIDEPPCHYRCRIGEHSPRCVSPLLPWSRVISSSTAHIPFPGGNWFCSLPKGHRGPHVACEGHGCEESGHANTHGLLTWRN